MSNDLLDEDEEADQSEEIGSENGLNMPIFVPILIPGKELNIKVWLLNQKQRHVSNIVHDWVGWHIKNIHSLSPVSIDPLHTFITGDAGCGKSFLKFMK